MQNDLIVKRRLLQLREVLVVVEEVPRHHQLNINISKLFMIMCMSLLYLYSNNFVDFSVFEHDNTQSHVAIVLLATEK